MMVPPSCKHEPVLITGDLNVDRYTSPDDYNGMLKVLDASDPFDPSAVEVDTLFRHLSISSTDSDAVLIERSLKPSNSTDGEEEDDIKVATRFRMILNNVSLYLK